MKRCIGYGPKGLPRVYGYDVTEAGALIQARQAAREYIVGRPDTGPLAAWHFDMAPNDETVNTVQLINRMDGK